MLEGTAAKVSAFVCVIAIWALSVQVGQISPSILPQVTDVATAMLRLLGSQAFWAALGLTVRDAVAGLAIASVIGVAGGILIGSSPVLERSTRYIVDFGRSFPQVALIPIFLTIFGASSSMKVILIATACVFPILLQTIYGARRLDSTLNDTVRAYGIPMHLRFGLVLLPAASPFIMTGFRISVVVSIIVAIAVEITSPIEGMGRELAKSRDYYETNVAIAYALYAGLLGIMANAVADRVEKTLLSWHFRSEAE